MIDCRLELTRGDFHLSVEAGFGPGISGIYGPSASGKTSLLLCLAGLLRPDQGHIHLGDTILCATADRHWLPVHRRGLVTVFQDDRLFPHRSVLGNLRYGWKADDQDLFATVVELLDLAPLLSRRIHHLSGGERQRVGLGRALLCRPKVLLLDEPFSALDAATTATMIRMLRRIHQCCALPMIIISHDLRTLLELQADLLILDHGRQRACGSLFDILADPAAAGLLDHERLVNVLPVVVSEQRPEDHASVLTMTSDQGQTGPALICPLHTAPPGTRLQAMLRPQDCIISLDRPERISCRNRLRGHIDTIYHLNQRWLVRITCGLPLLAEITPQAGTKLGLHAGQRIWLNCKATAITTVAV